MKKNITLLMLLFASIVLAVCVGRYPISLNEMLGAFVRNGNILTQNIVWSLRIPRVICCVLCGGALSLAGAIYQHMFRNPLVSGDLLGVSSGCCVGAICGLLLSFTPFQIQFLTFGCGIFTMCVTMGLAMKVNGIRVLNLVISGIVVSALADALIMLLKLGADPTNQLPAIEYWLMGGFSAVNWDKTLLCMGIVLPVMMILYLFRFQIDVLSFGREEAKTLGVPVRLVESIALGGATMLISAVIACAGMVSWVSLIAPHLVRLWYGRGIKQGFFAYFVGGAILTVLCDGVSRTLFPYELPISISTCLLGGILLIFLFQRKKVHL